MIKNRVFYILFLWLSSSAYATSQQSDTPDLLPALPDNYANIQVPAHFLTAEFEALDNMPADNPTTDAGATLGRVLFYDKKLSSNNTISCGNCHQQQHGFSNTNRSQGIGINGQALSTKTLPLTNLRYRATRFGTGFEVSPEATLEGQSLLAFTN